MAVTQVAADEAPVLEIRECPAKRLGRDAETAGQRREATAARTSDLGEDRQRPAVVAEGNEA